MSIETTPTAPTACPVVAPTVAEVQRLLSLLPQEERLKLVPVVKAKVRKVRKGERAIFTEALADFRTNRERLAAHEVVPGRVTVLAGLTKTEAGSIFDATAGKVNSEDLEGCEIAAGVAWVGKNGKVRSSLSGQVTATVQACLERIKAAPHGSFEQWTAKKELKELQKAA